MDNTELHYLTYDPDEMFQDMLTAYMNAGGGTIRAGDEKEMLLRGVQDILMLSFAGIDNALRMATLRYAVGDYLDAIGENRGCYRIEAARARATISITVSAGDPATIPAGSLVTEDGVQLYATDEEILLPGTAGTVTATITAETAGTGGNALASGMPMQFIGSFDRVENVVCSVGATGGLNQEEDEEYRERIRRHGLVVNTAGSADQYETIALATDGAVIDAYAVQSSAGSVTVYLIVDDSADADSVVAEVNDALDAASARPLTDHVTVTVAAEVDYTINVQIQTDNSVSQSVFQAAAAEYKEWQDNIIGRAFNPDRLKARLYQSGASLVSFTAGSAFDGGPCEYTEITSGQRCKGTIQLEVITG